MHHFRVVWCYLFFIIFILYNIIIKDCVYHQPITSPCKSLQLSRRPLSLPFCHINLDFGAPYCVQALLPGERKYGDGNARAVFLLDALPGLCVGSYDSPRGTTQHLGLLRNRQLIGHDNGLSITLWCTSTGHVHNAIVL